MTGFLTMLLRQGVRMSSLVRCSSDLWAVSVLTSYDAISLSSVKRLSYSHLQDQNSPWWILKWSRAWQLTTSLLHGYSNLPCGTKMGFFCSSQIFWYTREQQGGQQKVRNNSCLQPLCCFRLCLRICLRRSPRCVNFVYHIKQPWLTDMWQDPKIEILLRKTSQYWPCLILRATHHEGTCIQSISYHACSMCCTVLVNQD